MISLCGSNRPPNGVQLLPEQSGSDKEAMTREDYLHLTVTPLKGNSPKVRLSLVLETDLQRPKLCGILRRVSISLIKKISETQFNLWLKIFS